MQVCSVSNLTKQYPAFTLHNVSFDIRPGRITGFIGRNGAGKTTTFKALLHFIRPDGGEISFFGIPFTGHELEIKRRIGFVSGGSPFYPRKRLRVITDVTRRFYSSWDNAAYGRLMQLFELDERKTPAQLSEGMKVKYSLALALSHKAELLLLDEPTSGLDPVSRDELLDLLRTLAKQGITILFSTHITSDLEKCADDILYSKRGQIAGSGELKSFLAQYKVLHLTDNRIPEGLELIGCKEEKRGRTALVRAADLRAGVGEVEDADLEAVMVHMEREGRQNESFVL